MDVSLKTTAKQRSGGIFVVFAVTILLSAFLLFQVQPLIAKIILPWFGGSAAVWAAALLFFQVFLLGGYAYSHFVINRFGPRTQMLVHVGLLAASCALLPILPSPSWKPTGAADPTLRIIALLAVTVGLPYFLLSSTSPLLQAWYVRRTSSRVPYRLFALSNFGSLLGLLSFPFLVEPNFTSRQQANGWSAIYVAFVVLCAVVAWTSRRDPVAEEGLAPILGGALDEPPSSFDPLAPKIGAQVWADPPSPESPFDPTEPSGPPTISQLAVWVSLAAVASTLLVAVTTHLTQNVSPIPLLWVVPLALYLVTFIIAFEGRGLYKRSVFVPLLTPALVLMAYFVFNKNITITWLIPTFTLGLFVCCMVCHGELAERRPTPEHLTLFYLMVSLGGALGGVFVAILAPLLLDSYVELPIGLVACSVLAAVVLRNATLPRLTQEGWRMLFFFGICLTTGFLARDQIQNRKVDIVRARNFYGALSVSDEAGEPSKPAARRLFHGTIEHGSQLLQAKDRYVPTSYYGVSSGVGRVIRAARSHDKHLRVGIVGLGAGVLSAYGRAGDTFSYYEINPEVARIAQEQFSFYDHSKADKRITLGDARLSLERQSPQRFDILVVDAFSGDAIPVHLLTEEAFALYSRHLAPDGVLAVHVSNHYVNLVPVVAHGARTLGRAAYEVSDNSGPYTENSDWMIVPSDNALFKDRSFDGANPAPAADSAAFRGWTDDYSNIVQILMVE